MARPVAPIPSHIGRILAIEASVDPRSVRKYALGETLAPMPSARIAKAISKLGLESYFAKPNGARKRS
jgi:hypothetical protein